MLPPIEAVSICVQYSDILRAVAPHNRRLLDRWVVVTTPQDEETRTVCTRHSIEIVLCDEFKRNGDDFNKGRAINAGLRQLQGKGLLLHMDADICLPLDMAACLEDADLQPGNIYGCHRLCVPYSAWPAACKQGLYSRFNGWLTEFRDRPQGCYVGGVPAGLGNGYTPIGFFQLWFGQETLSWGSARKWYPMAHGGAARTDTQFSSLWDRRNRILIPELLVFHLEHDEAKNGMGHNWSGRTTPKLPPEIACPYDA